MASAARSICSPASALRIGSMSEEFSGQTTATGGGCSPAATSAASSSVTRTWLSSTARRWELKSRPSRGTLPCTTAIGCCPESGPPQSGQPAPALPPRTSEPEPAAHRRRSPLHGLARVPRHQESAPTQCDRERDSSRTADRSPPNKGGLGLPEGQSAPRETAERNPLAQRLHQHPEQWNREDPPPAAQQRGQQGTGCGPEELRRAARAGPRRPARELAASRAGRGRTPARTPARPAPRPDSRPEHGLLAGPGRPPRGPRTRVPPPSRPARRPGGTPGPAGGASTDHEPPPGAGCAGGFGSTTPSWS